LDYFRKRYNGSMNEQEIMRRLRKEGFSQTYVWEDRPNASYPEHVHVSETAHVILQGELRLSMAGETKTFREGERCDVPAGAVHSAKTGSRGCRYIIGER
jgi:quercetin dioxygenase-like cupin family protein